MKSIINRILDKINPQFSEEEEKVYDFVKQIHNNFLSKAKSSEHKNIKEYVEAERNELYFYRISSLRYPVNCDC